jgi:hypothetical protein
VPSGSSGAWTTPSVPIGTGTPTAPLGGGRCRVRIANSVMNPIRIAVLSVVTTISGVATVTNGPVGSPGAV